MTYTNLNCTPLVESMLVKVGYPPSDNFTPSWQEAFEFLRTKHHIHINVFFDSVSSREYGEDIYGVDFLHYAKPINGYRMSNDIMQCVEWGIKKSCEYLIENGYAEGKVG